MICDGQRIHAVAFMSFGVCLQNNVTVIGGTTQVTQRFSSDLHQVRGIKHTLAQVAALLRTDVMLWSWCAVNHVMPMHRHA